MRNKRKGSQEGSQTEGSQDEGSQYPENIKPLLCALGDPVKRAKLKRICESLSTRDLLKEVRFGCYGVTMHTVSELLEAF